MAQITQYRRLAELLAASDTVTKDSLAKAMGVASASVACYMFDLRKKFGAQVQNIYEQLPPGTRGRGKILAYRLLNAEATLAKVPKYRLGTIAPKDDGMSIVPILDKGVGELSEREMADIRDSLGLDVGE